MYNTTDVFIYSHNIDNTMDQIKIELGDRIVQHGGGAYLINIPQIAVKHLGLSAGVVMRWTLVGNELHLSRVEDTTESNQCST